MSQNETNPLQDFENGISKDSGVQSTEVIRWRPIKLWKAPIVSSYYHKAHLLIAADCSAFTYPQFYEGYLRGRIPLICCTESDSDILSKIGKILENNDIQSVTVVKTDKDCCKDLASSVMKAMRASRTPVPLQVSTIFVDTGSPE